MLENELHPLGTIAFAEARGQVPDGIITVEEIVLKKFEVVNEVLAKHAKTEADPPEWPHPLGPDPDPRGEQRWAQGWPGGCTI